MLLSVRERLVIQSVIPREGDYVTLKVLRKLQEKLGFSEEELKLYKFVQKENNVTWDDKVEQNKEIELGEMAVDIITKALKQLNDQKKLSIEHYDIYEKFVEKK